MIIINEHDIGSVGGGMYQNFSAVCWFDFTYFHNQMSAVSSYLSTLMFDHGVSNHTNNKNQEVTL